MPVTVNQVPYVAHLPDFYEHFILTLEDYSALPVDQINLLFMLLLQAVAGVVYSRIRNTLVRKIFGTIVGMTLMWSLYGIQESVGLLSFIVAMYPIIAMKNPQLTFWIAETALLSSFAYIVYFHYLSWRLDFTTSLMGIVVRLHTLTWDLYDAVQIKKGEKVGEKPREIEYRKEHACFETPNFFEYISYMLFFIHALCGSNLTINEYLSISDRTLFRKCGWKDPQNDPSPNFSEIMKAILEVVFTSVGYLVGQIFFPASFLTSKEFILLPYWKRIFYTQWTCFFVKLKYHFGWKCLDLSTLTSRCAFTNVIYDKDGKTYRIIWNRARNINSILTMFPSNTSEIVRNWNMTINDWLTNYIFFRVNPPKFLQKLMGGDFGAKVLITRITSALFHGLYPGYYIFFAYSAFGTNMIDLLRSIFPTYEDYDDDGSRNSIMAYFTLIFWPLFVNMAIDTSGFYFLILDIKDSLKLYQSIYWFPVPLTILGFIIGYVLKPILGRRLKKAKPDATSSSSNKTKSKPTKKE